MSSLRAGSDGSPKVGAPKYREMREKGESPLPKPVLLETAKQMEIPSRDAGRTIPCRIIEPEAGKPVKAVMLHIHGGGWVLMSEATQDLQLKRYADEGNLLCISVGYRLAPEHPFPAGANDCDDVAEWLIDHSHKTFGAELGFISGESAGGNLSALTALRLLRSSKPQHSSFRLKGLLLHFGVYDLSFTPQAFTWKKDPCLILDLDLMQAYRAAYLPGRSEAEMKTPDISPLYADLHQFELPAAFMTCGTEDLLLDDTVFFGTKWQMAGGEATVKIYPGAPHGFIAFPADQLESAKEGMEDALNFIRSKLP